MCFVLILALLEMFEFVPDLYGLGRVQVIGMSLMQPFFS